MSNWSINVDNGLLNGVVFIDLKKAFDTIYLEITLQKLVNHGVEPNSIRFLASCLGNRSQKCTVNRVLPCGSEITCGVLQGCILGHLLLLLFINDLPNCLNTAYAKMCADNLYIASSGCTCAKLEQFTNSELTTLHCWLKANKLSLNIAKREFVGSRKKLLAENYVERNIKLDNQPFS